MVLSSLESSSTLPNEQKRGHRVFLLTFSAILYWLHITPLSFGIKSLISPKAFVAPELESFAYLNFQLGFVLYWKYQVCVFVFPFSVSTKNLFLLVKGLTKLSSSKGLLKMVSFSVKSHSITILF